ncbi:hypothetical protein CY34DRAFT_785522, partial [Suillus luteus UH-Slu-Lm8-n1]
MDDLDESIQFFREAVSLCPEGHTDRVSYLNNLAVSLRFYRFKHQGNPNDLDEAISLHEEALCLCLVGHESRDSILDNLGGALVTRFNTRGAIDDITRAISLYREALMLCPPGHPRRDTTLNNLALALKTRYVELDNEDVEEAIDLCQKSLEALPSLHPDRHYSYFRLREAYLSRFRVHLNPADLSLAIENFKLASRHPTQGFPERIAEAIDWARQAEVYQHKSDLEAYQTCFELFNSHVMTRSSIIARREAASAFDGAQSLPVDAASCAIRRGNLPWAVELIEQGRGQQWSLASQLKTPVEDLESANPTLAHNYLELSKCVSNAAQSSATTTERAAADRAATEYRRLTRRWEAAVAEIRNLKDFSRFLLPPAYEDLQAAARHGPVIIFIASQYSCGAIIVPTSGDPHHVPLSSISLVDLNNL